MLDCDIIIILIKKLPKRNRKMRVPLAIWLKDSLRYLCQQKICRYNGSDTVKKNLEQFYVKKYNIFSKKPDRPFDKEDNKLQDYIYFTIIP